MAQNNTIHNILEVVVGTADIRSSNQVKSGKLRKIATRIYTSNMDDVESDDRALHPFRLQLHNLQALEEFLLSHEVGFERIDQHRFTKAAWAAQVIIRFISVGKLPDNICLVNIKVSILSDFLKRLDAYWQSSIVCLYHNS